MDGNRRIGQLWQTVIRRQYSPIFDFMLIDFIQQIMNCSFKEINTMKIKIMYAFIASTILSCTGKTERSSRNEIAGKWRLISGTLIEKGDTAVTDYTKNMSFIKIINDTHFAFLQHDLKKGEDSSAVFVAGGGRYSLNDSLYTEHLEYCSAREWEGNDFKFTISINDDTLIQTGTEIIENLGINRVNIEKYARVKG